MMWSIWFKDGDGTEKKATDYIAKSTTDKVLAIEIAEVAAEAEDRPDRHYFVVPYEDGWADMARSSRPRR